MFCSLLRVADFAALGLVLFLLMPRHLIEEQAGPRCTMRQFPMREYDEDDDNTGRYATPNVVTAFVRPFRFEVRSHEH